MSRASRQSSPGDRRRDRLPPVHRRSRRQRLFADLWWFREIGYDVVFVRTVTTRLLLFLVAGAVGSAVLYLNLSIAQRGVVPEPVMVRMGEAVAPVDVAGATRRLRLPISILFGIVFGLGVSATWQVLLQWLHRTPFDVADPVFSRDIGYYVFSLPALSVALGMIRTLAFVSLLATVPTYFFRGDVVVSPRRLRIEPSAGVHLAILLAVPFVVTALRLWFVDSAELLYSTTGPLVGASYTDLHATLPAIRVSAIAALAAAVVVLVGGARRMLGWYGVLAVGGYVSVAILGRGIVPAIMQKFVVAPTELTRETPYLERHIAATRRAWGIDSVQSRDLEGSRRSRSPRCAPTRPPSRTCGCGIARRCCAPLGSCRRSARTTTSCRSTTIGTGSMASTARSSSRRASSTPSRCPRARSSTST
ncbi:MAG: UPF0182 family protein [Gemmatimonadetes bacterium]|nr:UPF0182 family protein [Gemmatimonadota bacterium]